MASLTPTQRDVLEKEYETYAREYLESLPPEHFMEATVQGNQRRITLASLDLVTAHRPEVQLFNELLVQYERGPGKKPGQVVPDNMVIVHDEPIVALRSYDVKLQQVTPFWVLEYVSKSSQRKDYEENMLKYEKELKVPYYLRFYPDTADLSLFHRKRGRYVSVKPNERERFAIPDLELEMALHEGWVRFWFRGELLPLPGDLLRSLESERRERQRVQAELAAAKRQIQLKDDQLLELQARFSAMEEELRRAKGTTN
jgi:Uma2 family endonuclease